MVREAIRSRRFHRIKHSSGLEEPGLRVLRQLYVYRDEQAVKDRPPYKVIPNPVLVLIARKRPEKLEDLEHCQVRVHHGSAARPCDGRCGQSRACDEDRFLLEEKQARVLPMGVRRPSACFKLKNWDKVGLRSESTACDVGVLQLEAIAGWRQGQRRTKTVADLRDCRWSDTEETGFQFCRFRGPVGEAVSSESSSSSLRRGGRRAGPEKPESETP